MQILTRCVLVFIVVTWGSWGWALSPLSHVHYQWDKVQKRLHNFISHQRVVSKVNPVEVDWDHPFMFRQHEGVLGEILNRFELPLDFYFYFVLTSDSDDDLTLVVYQEKYYLPEGDQVTISFDPADKSQALLYGLDFMEWGYPVLKKGTIYAESLPKFHYLVFPSINDLVEFGDESEWSFEALKRLVRSLGLSQKLIFSDLKVELVLPEFTSRFAGAAKWEYDILLLNILHPNFLTHFCFELFKKYFERSFFRAGQSFIKIYSKHWNEKSGFSVFFAQLMSWLYEQKRAYLPLTRTALNFKEHPFRFEYSEVPKEMSQFLIGLNLFERAL